jgi:hypothetical protein
MKQNDLLQVEQSTEIRRLLTPSGNGIQGEAISIISIFPTP